MMMMKKTKLAVHGIAPPSFNLNSILPKKDDVSMGNYIRYSQIRCHLTVVNIYFTKEI